MTDLRRIRWLIDNLNACETLSDWEANTFLPSVTEQFERRGTLSDNQVATLEKIYQERDQ